ncbi:hypothetical protein AQUCO_02000553v1 [Aquilegia coerulea]|uniref:Transmembrane protein n=1 Tax=Aquilegia coerulea TaxID=218851 RepID=A0A2G5DI39_AQUCA|nr:hypothetical protein AQUCO_02000553v1 [Aquilegia coerulea]
MEGFIKGVQSFAKESKDSMEKASSSSYSSPSVTIDHSGVLVQRTYGRMVSLGTCSKLCAVGFIAGVVVGYTLKARVRRWAAKVLKRIRDD